MSATVREHPEKLLEALLAIGEELITTVDLDALLNRILHISREVFQFENAMIRLVETERNVLVTAAAYGYPEDSAATEIPLGKGITGRVAATGRPILVTDVARQPDYVAGIRDARSELAVPLVAAEQVIGVFNVESPYPGAFDEDDIPPLMTMAAQAAIAIENARLYRNLRGMSSRVQALHQLNDRILKSVNLGIYTVDDRLIITSWNPRMTRMSGVAEEDAVGRGVFELFPELEREGFDQRLRRVLEHGEPEKLRLTHRNPQGEVRIQKRRLAPLRDGFRVTGVVVIVEDITEFKRLLEQTIQSEKLAEVGRLSAGIAHEINNPLSVIAYAAQLLLRESGLPTVQAELVERIESETERLTALTGSLLSFSQAREMVRREVDLGDILKDVLRLVRYELQRNQIELRENYETLPAIQADPNKLKQVFINLIMNAAQAMAEGGVLTIGTRAMEDGRVEAMVADNGPGIPEEVRDRIFAPFFTTKKEGEGTGLGLYISRNIILEHDGALLLDSGSGGTTFRVVLPLD